MEEKCQRTLGVKTLGYGKRKGERGRMGEMGSDWRGTGLDLGRERGWIREERGQTGGGNEVGLGGNRIGLGLRGTRSD